MMKTPVSISSILSMTALLQSKYVNVCNFISSFKMCEFTWNLPFIIWINSYTYPKDVLFLPACFPGNLSEADVKCWFLVSVIHTHVFNRDIESGLTFFWKIWVEWLKKKIYLYILFKRIITIKIRVLHLTNCLSKIHKAIHFLYLLNEFNYWYEEYGFHPKCAIEKQLTMIEWILVQFLAQTHIFTKYALNLFLSWE